MKQSSDLEFKRFSKAEFETYGGCEPFCPNTVGAEPRICEATEDTIYIIDRRGYTALFLLPDGELEEVFLEFKHLDEPLAYWPVSTSEAFLDGWLKR